MTKRYDIHFGEPLDKSGMASALRYCMEVAIDFIAWLARHPFQHVIMSPGAL